MSQWIYLGSMLYLMMMIITPSLAISSPLSPLMRYAHSTELYPGIADLWWTIDTNKGEILMEFHVNTTGWIGIGISPGISLVH